MRAACTSATAEGRVRTSYCTSYCVFQSSGLCRVYYKTYSVVLQTIVEVSDIEKGDCLLCLNDCHAFAYIYVVYTATWHVLTFDNRRTCVFCDYMPCMSPAPPANEVKWKQERRRILMAHGDRSEGDPFMRYIFNFAFLPPPSLQREHWHCRLSWPSQLVQ